MANGGSYWAAIPIAIHAKYPEKFVLDPSTSGKPKYPRTYFHKQLGSRLDRIPPDIEDPEATLSIFAVLVEAVLAAPRRQDSVLVGVLKKGMSVLTEIRARRPALRRYEAISDAEIESANLRGRHVIVVDDSLQDGDTIIRLKDRIRVRGAETLTWTSIVSRADGIRVAEKWLDLNLSPHPVTNEMFDLQFTRILVPTLSSLSRGSISDRAFVEIELSHPTASPTQTLEDLLSAICEMPLAQSVLEVSRVDALPAPGFTVTVDLSSDAVARLETSLKEVLPDSPKLSFVKLRIFPCPGARFVVRVHAILHPSWVGNLQADFPHIIGATDRLLDDGCSQIVSGLRSRGYVATQCGRGRLVADQT